jgi:hypothetical protein
MDKIMAKILEYEYKNAPIFMNIYRPALTIELGWIGNLQWLNGLSCTVARIAATVVIQLML